MRLAPGSSVAKVPAVDIRALLFDFDGVILDTEWAIYETWRQLFADHGQALTLEDYVRCVGSDFATWSPETFLEELTGKTFDWPVINEARNVEIRRNIDVLDAMPGVRDLLIWCQQEEFPCAVVSSSTHSWVNGWLEKLELNDYFRAVVCRGDAPRIKPAPDLFQEAVRRLSLPAAGCLVIEDSLNGLQAAQETGCPVMSIPNRITSVVDFSAAELRGESCYEVLDLLRSGSRASLRD